MPVKRSAPLLRTANFALPLTSAPKAGVPARSVRPVSSPVRSSPSAEVVLAMLKLSRLPLRTPLNESVVMAPLTPSVRVVIVRPESATVVQSLAVVAVPAATMLIFAPPLLSAPVKPGSVPEIVMPDASRPRKRSVPEESSATLTVPLETRTPKVVGSVPALSVRFVSVPVISVSLPTVRLANEKSVAPVSAPPAMLTSTWPEMPSCSPVIVSVEPADRRPVDRGRALVGRVDPDGAVGDVAGAQARERAGDGDVVRLEADPATRVVGDVLREQQRELDRAAELDAEGGGARGQRAGERADQEIALAAAREADGGLAVGEGAGAGHRAVEADGRASRLTVDEAHDERQAGAGEEAPVDECRSGDGRRPARGVGLGVVAGDRRLRGRLDLRRVGHPVGGIARRIEGG